MLRFPEVSRFVRENLRSNISTTVRAFICTEGADQSNTERCTTLALVGVTRYSQWGTRLWDFRGEWVLARERFLTGSYEKRVTASLVSWHAPHETMSAPLLIVKTQKITLRARAQIFFTRFTGGYACNLSFYVDAEWHLHTSDFLQCFLNCLVIRRPQLPSQDDWIPLQLKSPKNKLGQVRALK